MDRAALACDAAGRHRAARQCSVKAAALRIARRAPWGLCLLAGGVPVAWGAPDGGAPCTWHVRLNYHYSDAAPQGAHDTRVQLALEAPMRCVGSGLDTLVSADGPPQAQGHAHVHRSLARPQGPSGLRDIADRQAEWPASCAPVSAAVSAAASAAASTPPSACLPRPAPAVDAPKPSFVGTGLGTELIVDAALDAPVRSTVPEAQESPALPKAPGLTTAVEPPADDAPLHLELYFDPLPGEPSDPAGALARIPERTRAALAAAGGEAALALRGHFFGAQTQTTADGDFSVCYRKTLALAPTRLEVDFCGWLTRGARPWAPENLPPQ